MTVGYTDSHSRICIPIFLIGCTAGNGRVSVRIKPFFLDITRHRLGDEV